MNDSAHMDLATTQQWMQAVVMHPDGIEAGLNDARAAALSGLGAEGVAAIVHPSKTQTIVQRLNVYGYAYFARLINILKEDYSAVAHALGADAFRSLAKAFLVAYPSQHYNLNQLGARFPQYLREDAPHLEHRAFLAELAQLERAIQEVFDERGAKAISADALWDIPQDAWYDTTLRLTPATRLFAFEYPVNVYLQGVREKTGPAIPVAPMRSWALVYRFEWTVYRSDLPEPRYALIKALAQGGTLGDAIEAALDVPGVEPEELVGKLREWFRIWTGVGLFSHIAGPAA